MPHSTPTFPGGPLADQAPQQPAEFCFTAEFAGSLRAAAETHLDALTDLLLSIKPIEDWFLREVELIVNSGEAGTIVNSLDDCWRQLKSIWPPQRWDESAKAHLAALPLDAPSPIPNYDRFWDYFFGRAVRHVKANGPRFTPGIGKFILNEWFAQCPDGFADPPCLHKPHPAAAEVGHALPGRRELEIEQRIAALKLRLKIADEHNRLTEKRTIAAAILAAETELAKLKEEHNGRQAG